MHLDRYNISIEVLLTARDSLDDGKEIWERKLLCHIPPFTPNLGLWLMTTMMIILRSIVCENVDGGIYIKRKIGG